MLAKGLALSIAVLDSLVCLLVESLGLGDGDGSQDAADVDQVELLGPGPWLGDVVDLEHAVCWQPAGWWWVEINTADSCCEILAHGSHDQLQLPNGSP